jgi:DNA-binding transcriptional ArsR family regulator
MDHQLHNCEVVIPCLVVPHDPSIPHPLPEFLVGLLAARFRVLAEPMRIKLLDRLRDGDATVGELAEALGASQQNVSKHLGVLLSAGIVARTKRCTSSVYSIADRGVFELCEQICGGIRRQASERDAILQGGQAA